MFHFRINVCFQQSPSSQYAFCFPSINYKFYSQNQLHGGDQHQMEIELTNVLREAATCDGAQCYRESCTIVYLGPNGLRIWSTKTQGPPFPTPMGVLCHLRIIAQVSLPHFHWVPANKDSGWMNTGRRVRNPHFVPSLVPTKGKITTYPHCATCDLCYL